MENQTKKSTLLLLEEDNGFCRVYYREIKENSKRLLCYQLVMANEFELLECTKEGEPSHTIPYEEYIHITPFPAGYTAIGQELKEWLSGLKHLTR